MFGSEVLEVAIGLVLTYLVLALVCTTVVEWIARVLALRSNTLYAGIEALLFDADLARRLYQHPLIDGYARGSKLPTPFNTRPEQPSYIPSHLFALALFQVLPSVADASRLATTETGAATHPGGAPATLDDLRRTVEALPAAHADVRGRCVP